MPQDPGHRAGGGCVPPHTHRASGDREQPNLQHTDCSTKVISPWPCVFGGNHPPKQPKMKYSCPVTERQAPERSSAGSAARDGGGGAGTALGSASGPGGSGSSPGGRSEPPPPTVGSRRPDASHKGSPFPGRDLLPDPARRVRRRQGRFYR